MKKIKFIAMAMLALLTAQCKKNEPEPEPKVMVPISGSVSFGGGSKTEITTTGYVTPKSGDMIYIYHAGDYVGSLTCTPGTGQAFNCSGEIEQSCLGQACTFMYLGSGSTDDKGNPIDGTNSTISFADQTGISVSSGKISGIDKFHVGSCKANVSDEGTVSLPMRTKISIAYFQLKVNGQILANADVNVQGEGLSSIANINKTDGTISGDGPGTIRVHTDANGCFYMALVPHNEEVTFGFSFSAANGTDVFPYGIHECTLYSEQADVSKPLLVQMDINAPVGAIPGQFSVSAGKKVYFSQGNLQYIGSGCSVTGESATAPYWRFANNQWDCIGNGTNDGCKTNIDYINATYFNNSNKQAACRDLFGFGANGNGTNPWQTSSTLSNYPETLSANKDWGYNPIYNGGNVGGMWCTLTQPEWDYVINSRTTYDYRFAAAQIHSKNGVILFPDGFVCPSNITIKNRNKSSANPTGNTITDSDWLKLELLGCVFLPANYYRNQTTLDDLGGVGYTGNYWTSTKKSTDYAYYFYMLHSDKYTIVCDGADVTRHYGFSVRLVHDVNE